MTKEVRSYKTGEQPEPDTRPDTRQTVEELQEEHALQNPIHQVYFRAGLIACREHMAGFVESTHPEIAESIRANWWPQLGGDFGPPRKLDFAEIADGGEEGPWTVKPLSPTQEALPIALGFLETCKP